MTNTITPTAYDEYLEVAERYKFSRNTPPLRAAVQLILMLRIACGQPQGLLRRGDCVSFGFLVNRYNRAVIIRCHHTTVAITFFGLGGQRERTFPHCDLLLVAQQTKAFLNNRIP